MLDEGSHEHIDAQFSALDERSRKMRRKSIAQTVALVVITGLLVLRLANDIVQKQAQVQSVEKSRGELDQRLKSEQEKLSAAIQTREKLEGEIKDLEATKRSYQNRILGEKEAGNVSSGAGKAPEFPLSPTNGQPDPDDAAVTPPSLIIEEVGKAPEGFFIKPSVIVQPGQGSSGRDVYKILLSLEVPATQHENIEQVSYHLSPNYYLRNQIEGGGSPNFEAKFNVFACESTVLARVKLRGGTTLAVDFDWCREKGWPERKREPVIVSAEDEKKPPRSNNAPQPSETPGITRPGGKGPGGSRLELNSEEPGREPGRRAP
jgi:cell division protein ZapA (FtsZ GTPase activity inhibitor)